MAKSLSPEERSLRARAAAHALHGSRDTKLVSAPGRQAFLDGFRRKAKEIADARGEVLTETELERRAQHLLKAHMTGLSLASAKARRREASAHAS